PLIFQLPKTNVLLQFSRKGRRLTLSSPSPGICRLTFPMPLSTSPIKVGHEPPENNNIRRSPTSSTPSSPHNFSSFHRRFASPFPSLLRPIKERPLTTGKQQFPTVPCFMSPPSSFF
ncbi:hypothetical protein AABB24_018587, partial [Solanum stoloniferum]